MRFTRLVSSLVFLASIAIAAPPATLADLKQAFQRPPDDARIMMRWWWFGPAVTKPELEREMRQMKDGGIGGFEVQPVYPLQLDDPALNFHNFAYLSPEFLDALNFTAQKARELGLRMDMTLGSGWPFGGPHIPITQAAGRLRVVPIPADTANIRVPKLADGEKLLAVFLVRGADVQRLTDIEDGSVRVPTGPGFVQFFIAGHTRMQVKRPAIGAEGFVLDHYDRAAIENHLKTVADKLIQATGSNPPYAVFSDSLEVMNSDWTSDFLEQFERRRGYDLTPYLPALAVDIGDKTADIRHDWGLTLTELANERYLAPIEQWAKQHGTRFRSQNYGTPPVTLSSNALVDLPEGEGWMWRKFSATRWAASASHLYGKPVTSAETWTWLHSPAFHATPLDMKAEADLHFLMGINQLIGHGWPYSPPSAGEPGWRFYAAAVFNDHNPWWFVMPDVAEYLQRISYLLRQGRPANDVALYLPTDDAWAGFTVGHDSVNQAMDGLIGPNVIPAILNAGYNFDFIDDPAIAANSPLPYRVLILPRVHRIPPASYRKIEEFARNGGIVIATSHVPSLAPGFKESQAGTPQVREISHALFESTGARGKLVANDSDIGNVLHSLLPADVAAAPEIGFIHRKLDFADAYFLANTSNHPVHVAATFRISGLDGAWWDPYTGDATAAEHGNRIQLNLEPYESRVIVFSKTQETISPPITEPTAIDLSKGWKITIDGASTAVPLKTLHSWADDDATKYFSGHAAYQRTVTIATPVASAILDFGPGTPVNTEEHRTGNGMRAMLDSPVREAAIVYVNGKRAGSVWHPPYQVDIAALLHPGDNELRVVVANTAINQMAGANQPDYRALNARYGERFQPQDMNNLQPVPSGLLGPIRLLLKAR